MNNQIPEYTTRALHELRYAVQRDSYNLTRDDHDAILCQIDILEQFIKERYERYEDIKHSSQC